MSYLIWDVSTLDFHCMIIVVTKVYNNSITVIYNIWKNVKSNQ